MTKKKKLMIIGATVPTAIIVPIAIAVPIILNKKAKELEDYHRAVIAQNRVNYLESEMTKLINSNANQNINILSLRKSLKMSLDLYRGGFFDLSETKITFGGTADYKNISYREFSNFIDKASLAELQLVNSEFTKVKFCKKFWLPIKGIYEVNQAIAANKTPNEVKNLMITYGVNGIYGARIDGSLQDDLGLKYDDFDFFANGNTGGDQVQIDLNKFLTPDEFNRYVKYWDDTTQTWESISWMKNTINSLGTIGDIKTFLQQEDKYQQPYVVTNLQDDLLIKFKDAEVKDITPEHEHQNNQGQEVDVQYYNEWDPVFGIKNSWSQFEFFTDLFYANNVISPLFLYKKHQIKKWNSFGSAGTYTWDTHENKEKFKLFEDDVINNSDPYQLPLDYQDIMNYKSSDNKLNRSLIPLSSRNTEKELHSTQSPDHGINLFTNIDMYNEEMTQNWYPHSYKSFPTMWQYMNKVYQWGWKYTFPAQIDIDTAHRNGSEIYGSFFTDYPSTMVLNLWADTEENQMIFIDNLIKILKDKGMDGIFWNAEMGGWTVNQKASGMTPGSWYSWAKLTKYISREFAKNGLKLLVYSNGNKDIVRTPQEQQWFMQKGLIDQNRIPGPEYWQTAPTPDQIKPIDWSIRRKYMTPAHTFAVRYHYDENYNVIDDGLGFGKDSHNTGKDDLFVGSMNLGLWNLLKTRVDFSKSAYGSKYNQIIMGTEDWRTNDNDLLKKEMEQIIRNKWSDKYYADYTLYISAAGMGNYDEEWDLPTYIARGANVSFPSSIIGSKAYGYDSTLVDDKYNTDEIWLDGRTRIPGYFSQDPRSVTSAYSNYFQEKSPLGDSDFFTAFNPGYGHNFYIDGKSAMNDWHNNGMQDIFPTYRYLIDVIGANGHQIDDEVNNYTKRKVNGHIKHSSNPLFGPNTLSYSGSLNPNESFINKLYVTKIQSNKEFSIYVKGDNSLTTTLQVWRDSNVDNRHLSQNAGEVAPTKVENLSNGYKKLTFAVPALATSTITSFGIKVKNTSGGVVDLNKFEVGGISYENTSQATHAISNVRAFTNNAQSKGINVMFDDSGFDGNTRYIIKDKNGKVITISSRPEFHIDNADEYHVEVVNPLGKILATKTITLNPIKNTQA